MSSRFPFLAGSALAAVFVLTACPNLQSGTNATTSLTLKALAVTAKDTTVNDYLPVVYLSWNEVPGAAKYELNRQGSTVPMSGCGTTECTDSKVKEDSSYTYTVRALDTAGAQKIASMPVTVSVIKHAVTAPESLEVTPSTADKVTKTTPDITWSKVDAASGYYVKVYQIDTKETVFSALTESTTITVGQLPLASASLMQFPQKGKDTSLVGGNDYRFIVQALAADSKTLADAKAVDVSDEVIKLKTVSN